MLEQRIHPTTDELSAFSLGQLPNDEAASVENHIGNCETCCETLLGLEAQDTFLGLLRQSRRTSGDQTVGLDGLPDDPSSTSDVPAQLAEHPRYEILGLIGKGGMGDVFKARHRMMERMVALKVIKHELVRKPEAVDRFHREVKTAASLSHPNIVTAHDADHVGDVHFLVMEFVDGVNLDEVIRQRGPLPVDQAIDYIRQAAAGLQHAHEQGMVHRDIKPHNLMLASSGEVKILDFGLASFVSEMAAEEVRDEAPETIVASHHAPYHLTKAGSMMGTPDYIAPEQAEDAHTADIRSDIYSLGCTFYTLLVGHAPFGSGSVLDKIRAHREQPPPPLSAWRDDVPAEVEGILLKMLAKNPTERFQSPADVVTALSEYRRLATERAAGTTPKPTLARRRPWAILAVASLLVALFLAGTVIYIQTDYGVVRVEVADESLQVTVNGRTIEMKDGATPVTIRTGEQKLIVRRGDFEFETDSFRLRRGDKIAIKVELLAGAITVHKDGDRFAAKALPGSDLPKQAKNDFVVTLKKDGRYLADGRPVDDVVELMHRLKSVIELNPDRDVVVVSPKEYGIEPVKQLVALVRQLGGKRVRWPEWVTPEQTTQLDTQLAAESAKLERTFDAPSVPIFATALSPDGKLLAGIGGIPNEKGTVDIWEVASGRKLRSLPVPTGKPREEPAGGPWFTIAFAPDNRHILVGGRGTKAQYIDAVKGQVVHEFGKGGAALSHDGTWAMVFYGKRQLPSQAPELISVDFYKVDSGKMHKTLGSNGGQFPQHVVLSRDFPVKEGKLPLSEAYVTALGEYGGLTIWSFHGLPKVLSQLPGGIGKLGGALALIDRSKVLSGDALGDLSLREAGSQDSSKILKIGMPIHRLAVSADEKRVLVAGPAGQIVLVEIASMIPSGGHALPAEHKSNVLWKFCSAVGAVRDVAYLPSGREFVTVEGNRDIDIDVIDKGECVIRLWQLPESVWPKPAMKPVVVTLKKGGRYVVDGRPVDDAVELMNRIKSAIELNPDREVVVDSPKEYGIEPVKQLVALIRQVGGKRVQWPEWVPAEKRTTPIPVLKK